MYTITSIQQAKKRESRVNIYLDNAFWIGLDKNDLIAFQLFRNKEISDDEKKEIEQVAGFNKMLEKAINYTFVRPRSEKEMRDYLQFKRGLSPEESERMISKLKEKGFLDDRKFAEWFAKNRLEFGVHGENKIYAELMAKGISSSLAREVIKSFQSEESEEETLRKIQDYANKVSKSIKAKSPLEHQQKLIQKLLSRGFKYSDIQKSLKNIDE